MKRLLLQTLSQLHFGQLLSGIGFAAYLLTSALELPDGVQLAVSALFGLAALWTMLSIIRYPRERREEISYNVIWGQGAVTLILVACAVLTARQMLGA